MTVTELSKITGYSISTVSKALSDSAEIGDKAKEKILKAAMETGYYNKVSRRKKLLGTPKTVGIVCDEYSDFRLLRNISRALDKQDFKTVITMNEDGAGVLERLGADCALFLRREPTGTSLPYVIYEGDMEATVTRLIDGNFEEADEERESSSQNMEKKEDIWLF